MYNISEHSFTSPDRIIAALLALGFICLKGEMDSKDCWILDDAREIQGCIFKCAAGWFSVDMESYQSSVDNDYVYDGDIGNPADLVEFKEWIAKQTKLSPYW
jgi:hypothetical protein